MRIPKPVVFATSSGLTTAVSMFWQEAVVIMLPWLMVVCAAVIGDLASGHYKASRLGVHFAWSTALRETLGKLVVYAAAVMTFAMFDVASDGNAVIAKWLSVFVSSIEIGSMISNLLAPHGIKLSLKAVLKLLLKKSPFGIDDEAADEIIRVARREDAKWNKRKYTGDENIDKRPPNRILDDETGKVTYLWEE